VQTGGVRLPVRLGRRLRQCPRAFDGRLGLGQPSPHPVEMGEQVPGLGQAQPVAEAVEGGDGQLDLVATLAEELPGVVDGGDAEAADGGVQGEAFVADRLRRPGQLLVGPGGLGEPAAALLGLGQRGQGGQPQRMLGRQQAGRPAEPGLDQPGVPRTAARCPAAA
jgi:hypothetical protein